MYSGNVRELSSSAIFVALERAERIFDYIGDRLEERIESVLGLDSLPLPQEEIRSIDNAKRFYEERKIKDSSDEIKLTSLMYHLNIENIGDLLYPLRLEPRVMVHLLNQD